MRNFRIAILTAIAAAIFSVPGCSTLGIQTHAQKVEAACAAVASAVQTLAYARAHNQLSSTEISAVNSAVDVTTPICESPTVPSNIDLKSSAFASAISALTAIAAQHGVIKSG